MLIKYTAARIVPQALTMSAASPDVQVQIKPVSPLDTRAINDVNPANEPIAEAVSPLGTIVAIRALDMPSVAAAYIPYIRKATTNIQILVATAMRKQTIANRIRPPMNVGFRPTLSPTAPNGNAAKAKTRLQKIVRQKQRR